MAVETKTCVSINEVLPRFHAKFTQLEAVLDLKLRVVVLTDEDALDCGDVREPNILFCHPDNKDEYIVALTPSLGGTDPAEICGLLGIRPSDPVWTLHERDEIA